MFSSKTTTTTDTVYYLLVQIDGRDKPTPLRGSAKWMPELPLMMVGDTIEFSVPRNTPQYGFAQLRIHYNKRESQK